MDHNEELPDETKGEQYGIYSFQCGFQKHTWLSGLCNLNEVVEILLLTMAVGIREIHADPEASIEISKFPPNRRRRALQKRAREINKEAVAAHVQRLEAEERTEEAHPEMVQFVNYLVTYITTNLPDALHLTLFHLIQEGILAHEMIKLDGQSSVVHDPDNEIISLVNDYKQQVKKRIGLTRKQRKVRYNLSELLNHYITVLPLWQDAKDIYKDNRNRNWKRIIDTVHPYLPDDLVARLSGNPADLSDEIKAKLAEKGGTSEPSDIAVEHAARLCGAPDYGYALSTLEGKKTELNRAAKTL